MHYKNRLQDVCYIFNTNNQYHTELETGSKKVPNKQKSLLLKNPQFLPNLGQYNPVMSW